MNGGALRIRLGGLHDTDAILDIYSSYITDTAVTFEEVVPTREEYRERMAPIFAEYPCLICEQAGRAVAYAYAHRHQSRAAYRYGAELSIYSREGCTGHGIGRALYGALLELLRLQNVMTAYGGVATPNPASERLHESMGFNSVGVWRRTGYKLGEWRDVTWYERPLGDYPENPAPFIPITALDAGDIVRIIDTANERLGQ